MTPQQSEDSRNQFIFMMIAMAMIAAYYFFVAMPQEKAARARMNQQVAAQAQAKPKPTTLHIRDDVLKATQARRVRIETPTLTGSLSLDGPLLDDLTLTKYRETPSKTSDHIQLFRPWGSFNSYVATAFWSVGGQDVSGIPWKLVSGSVLTPGRPVELEAVSAQGFTVHRHIEVDDKYMFTVRDTLTNSGGGPIDVNFNSSVGRQGLPNTAGRNAFEGAIGVFPKEQKFPDKKVNFTDKAWKEKAVQSKNPDWKTKDAFHDDVQGGWLGLSDKYWMGAVIPEQGKAVHSAFTYQSHDPNDPTFASSDIYVAQFAEQAQHLTPGRSTTATVHIFAGPKEDRLLQTTYSWVPNFRLAIDWGWVWFVSQPIFWLLQTIRSLVVSVFGAFPQAVGVSILLLTVVVRGAMFPLALQGYASMSKMKKFQPLVDELRQKYKDDPTKQQQEMMALYQREKINPFAGCLPMLATIPVFYALFSVLSVSIELRQQPFFGWIQDLSAPDPTTIWNLFGLIPWDPSALPLVGGVFAGFLHIGVWPLLYGATTFLQVQMSPTSTAPEQQMLMKFMPLLFMAFLAMYPAGLLIYYVWSNIITIGQQWFMMNRHGVENPIDKFIARFTQKTGTSVAVSRKQG